MPKEINVLIVEDDPYARDMMGMLLARDWRTHVVGETDNRMMVRKHLEDIVHVDVIILDTEVPWEPSRPVEIARLLGKMDTSPAILATATHPDVNLVNNLLPHNLGGYILKQEVLYSLGEAVAMAAQGYCVVTPGVIDYLPVSVCRREITVISGSDPLDRLTPRQAEILRLGLLFNLSQRDIADELVISRDWVAEAISTAYERLGLHDLLAGEIEVSQVFESKTIQQQAARILEKAKGSRRKTPWMSTLAFHLLTRPQERS